MTTGRARLFVDAGPFLALLLPRDPDHDAARMLFQRITDGEWRSVHTSDYVVAEVLNFIRKKIKRQEVAETFLALVFGTDDTPPVVSGTVRVHSGLFARALDAYRNRFDLGLSFTDWTTVAAIDDGRADEVATFDGGFHGTVGVVDL